MNPGSLATRLTTVLNACRATRVASMGENPPRRSASSAASVTRRLPSDELVRVVKSGATPGCARNAPASESISALNCSSQAADSSTVESTSENTRPIIASSNSSLFRKCQ